VALPPSGSTRPRLRALTASAALLGDPESEVAKLQREGWQAQALYYARVVPELSFASQFYAKMMRNLRIFPALLEPDGRMRRIEDDLPVRLLNRIQDPGGGISGIMGSYGRLGFITGEGQLFGRFLGDEREEWRYVWNDELIIDSMGAGQAPRKITWKPLSSQEGSTYEWGSEAISYRFWTPDPSRSGDAWSPMRASLQVAGELVALTAAVMATAVSRTTQGIFVVPQEIAPAPAEGGSDEDPLMEPLMEDLVNHMIAAKENVGTAEAAAPFILAGAHEFLQNDLPRLVSLHDRQNDYAERELRREAVERLAQGLDMPKEMLTGVGQTNHWAAKQIMDDRWRSHGSEMGQQFCNDLNQAYYRPALKDAGWEEWRRTVIGMDDSAIIMPADMLDPVREAVKIGAISRAGLRKLLNIPEDMAPEEAEEQQLIEIITRGALTPEQNGSSAPSAQPDAPGSEGDSGRRTRVTASAELNGGFERERGAAELALLRCREMAGNRIRNKDRGCAAGVPSMLVAAKVGKDGLDRLELQPRALVKGGTDLLRPVLAEMGYEDTHIQAFCDTIEAYATKTLLEETVSLPQHLAANLALVRSAA
jgi:hypothetical protein